MTREEKLIELDRLMCECRFKIQALGIEVGEHIGVDLGYNYTNGYCVKDTDEDTNEIRYIIYINPIYFRKGANKEYLKSVMFHELLHTVDGCMEHNKKWHEYANIVNETYNVNTHMAYAKEDILNMNIKPIFTIKCECGFCQNIYNNKLAEQLKKKTNIICAECPKYTTITYN